ncbi:MAG TPA: hypothetical protein VLG50_04550 [Candidatus Saccharimonadales bacterium]|nr:hypothetical protein [Candidatus Saccharimonadales bacterium]
MKKKIILINLFFLVFFKNILSLHCDCSQDFIRGVEMGTVVLSSIANAIEIQSEISSSDTWKDACIHSCGSMILGSLQLGALLYSLNNTSMQSEICPTPDISYLTFPNCVISAINIWRVVSYHINRSKWSLEFSQNRLRQAEEINILALQDLRNSLRNPIVAEVIAPLGNVVCPVQETIQSS